MYYEKIKTKRPEGIIPSIGKGLAKFAKFLSGVAEEMQFVTEEKEVKL